MSKPEISIIDSELMSKSEEAEYKADCYILEHWDEFNNLSPIERQKKLAEVMYGVK